MLCVVCCTRCDASGELINHVFFELLPAVQVLALSKVPSNPNTFPTQSIFAYVDHLFWRISPQIENDQFAWIL